MLDIKRRFTATYSPVLTQFLAEIREVKYDRIPQPFLPVCGDLYPQARKKIMFVGIETKGWGNITEFVRTGDRHMEVVFDDTIEEFNELEFCYWGNNFGNGFWDFNFKFLAAFHKLENWKTLKKKENDEVLRSFAWGNANAIERYHVTAKHNGVEFSDWDKVKTASKSFDKGGYLINVFRPDIMVITNWDAHESWLQQETLDILERQEIDSHLWYYFLPSTQTHVLWTAHPRWLSKNREFDDYIEFMVDFVNQKL